MTEEQARQILAGRRAETLVEVIEGGWADMVAEGRKWRKSTRANVVHDFMVERADRALVGLDGVHRIERYRIPMYVFDQQAIVRFKKHDGAMLTRNISTQHQLGMST